RISVGSVVAAIDAEGEVFGNRPVHAEADALRVAFVAVLRLVGIEADRAGHRVAWLFGDDVHHAASGTRAIARRGRTADHLDPLYCLDRHPVAVAARVALAAAPHADRIARADRFSVHQDQRVLRPHAAQI